MSEDDVQQKAENLDIYLQKVLKLLKFEQTRSREKDARIAKLEAVLTIIARGDEDLTATLMAREVLKS